MMTAKAASFPVGIVSGWPGVLLSPWWSEALGVFVFVDIMPNSDFSEFSIWRAFGYTLVVQASVVMVTYPVQH